VKLWRFDEGDGAEGDGRIESFDRNSEDPLEDGIEICIFSLPKTNSPA
jgi:hypothetical protein